MEVIPHNFKYSTSPLREILSSLNENFFSSRLTRTLSWNRSDSTVVFFSKVLGWDFLSFTFLSSTYSNKPGKNLLQLGQSLFVGYGLIMTYLQFWHSILSFGSPNNGLGMAIYPHYNNLCSYNRIINNIINNKYFLFTFTENHRYFFAISWKASINILLFSLVLIVTLK